MKKIARELVAVAKALTAAKKGKYSDKDVEAVTKQLEEYIKRGGREYGDFQFNIKLYRVDVPDSVTDVLGDNEVGDISMEEASVRVQNLAEDVKGRFGWVGDAGAAGRSGGWFMVTDDDSTMDSLERAVGQAEARDELDENDPYYEDDWKDLEEEVTGAVEEGKRKVRDLKEIEKMVKAGIAAYRKDMNSEGWWENYL